MEQSAERKAHGVKVFLGTFKSSRDAIAGIFPFIFQSLRVAPLYQKNNTMAIIGIFLCQKNSFITF
jgi:hypothetical protein